jgi:membrane protease YdiL (CAAX protease family)
MASRRQQRWLLLSAILFEGALGLAAWGLAGPSLAAQWRWHVIDAGLGAFASLPMFVAFLACLQDAGHCLSGIRRVARETIRPLFAGYALWELAAVAAMAGLGEELLFRGVIQASLGRWLNPWAGMVLASLIFGFMHPMSRDYVMLATLMGAYLGWLLIATGNLLAPVVAHGLYDFLALAYLTRSAGAKCAQVEGVSAADSMADPSLTETGDAQRWS